MEKNFAANHQEKNRSTFESIGNAKAAIFGAFLSTLSAHNAEAMDFSVGTDWLSGAVTMQYAMEHTQNEFAGLFVIAPGEEGIWFNPVDGETDSVQIDHKKDRDAIGDYVVDKSLDDTFRVCVAHTHPTYNHEQYVFGPSMPDLNIDNNFNKYVQKTVSTSMDVHIDVQGMVFETYGVWYYKISDAVDEEITDEVSSINTTVGTIMNKFRDTLEQPEIDDNESSMQLLKARLVLAQKGVQTRFVKYADFFLEPPCAGVKYK
jgi:hypothetical protein